MRLTIKGRIKRAIKRAIKLGRAPTDDDSPPSLVGEFTAEFTTEFTQ